METVMTFVRSIRVWLLFPVAFLVFAPTTLAVTITGIMDVHFTAIEKGADRWANGASPFEYIFDACVGGSGISSVTLSRPGGGAELILGYEGNEEWCYTDRTPTTIQELDDEYPGGDYTFTLTQTGGPSDSKTIGLPFGHPGWLLVSEPAPNSTVTPSQNIKVQWSLLRQDESLCSPASDCGDGLVFLVENETTELDVWQPNFPISCTGAIMPGGCLDPLTNYSMDSRTYFGTSEDEWVPDVTDNGDAIFVASSVTHNNAIPFSTTAPQAADPPTECPEPGAAGLVAGALLLAALKRRRGGD
jgi:hypothetical protein